MFEDEFFSTEVDPLRPNPLVNYLIGTAKPIEECGKDHIQVPSTTAPTPPAAYPTVYDDHGYAAGQGFVNGRAEQGGTPEPEPDAPQTLHSVALGMVDTLRHRIGVTPQICDTIERAIREPMAEQQAAPKPEPSHAPARLRQCPTHGQQSENAWGCPECVRELREEVARLKGNAREPDHAPSSDKGLVGEVLDALGEGIEADVEARAAIFAVAKWLEKYKPSGHETEPTSADFFAYVLRQEAQR
jgi:hypothetical protein